jgi:hypothetical protein
VFCLLRGVTFLHMLKRLVYSPSVTLKVLDVILDDEQAISGFVNHSWLHLSLGMVHFCY